MDEMFVCFRDFCCCQDWFHWHFLEKLIADDIFVIFLSILQYLNYSLFANNELLSFRIFVLEFLHNYSVQIQIITSFCYSQLCLIRVSVRLCVCVFFFMPHSYKLFCVICMDLSYVSVCIYWASYAIRGSLWCIQRSQ